MRPRPRLRSLALTGLVTLAGCRHRGFVEAPATDATADAQVPETPETIELIVLGQPRAGAASRRVAAALDARLGAEAPGRLGPAILLWLGTDADPRGPDRAACSGAAGIDPTAPGLAELAEVIARHRQAGALEAWSLAGPDDWRCGRSGFEAAMAPPLPASSLGPAAVLRIDDRGGVTRVDHCESAGCTIDPPGADTRLELVALDVAWWHYPDLAGDDLDAALLAQQASLLAALREQPGPPRLLLSTIPVDSAGTHGFGGRLQRTGVRYLPPPLQQALHEGLFIGVLAGLERSLQVSEDLSDAIVRSDRSFTAAPIFQVIAGSAGGANHTPFTSRGNGLLPDLESEHLGFARILLTRDRVDVRVHARVAGRWREASVVLPLRRPANAEVRTIPTIQPCQDCDPIDAAADGPAFVPRGERPH